VDYLSVQSEPQNRRPNGYPGTDLPVRQEARVIEALGPLLHQASPRTKILAYDHNWATLPATSTARRPGRARRPPTPTADTANPPLAMTV
jgi:glucosylceramidase